MVWCGVCRRRTRSRHDEEAQRCPSTNTTGCATLLAPRYRFPYSKYLYAFSCSQCTFLAAHIAFSHHTLFLPTQAPTPLMQLRTKNVGDAGAWDELQGAAAHPQPHRNLNVLSTPKFHLHVEPPCTNVWMQAICRCTHIVIGMCCIVLS